MLKKPQFVANLCYNILGNHAQVAELADALASGASEGNLLEVRVFFWAPCFCCIGLFFSRKAKELAGALVSAGEFLGNLLGSSSFL